MKNHIKKALTLILMVMSIQSSAHIYHQTKNYDHVGYCCYRQDGTYVPQTIRWSDDFNDEWPRHGVTNRQGIVGFSNMSEQPLTSGFERESYNTPK